MSDLKELHTNASELSVGVERNREAWGRKADTLQVSRAVRTRMFRVVDELEHLSVLLVELLNEIDLPDDDTDGPAETCGLCGKAHDGADQVNALIASGLTKAFEALRDRTPGLRA